MSDDKDMKKVLNLLSKQESSKKPPKDIKTSLLQNTVIAPGNDIKKEHFRWIEKCGIAKISLIYFLYKNEVQNNAVLKKKGEEILSNLTNAMKEKIDSLKPTIMSDGKLTKFRFYEGSESIPENFNDVKASVRETILLNRINLLGNLHSEAFGFITIIEKELWHREDGIEEIDGTADFEPEKPMELLQPVEQSIKPLSKEIVIDKEKKNEINSEELEKVINGG